MTVWQVAFSGWLIVVKLLVLPLIAATVGSLMGLTGLYFQIVAAVLPTASSAYILAMRMGGDGSVAWLISVSTLVSMLTLTLWASWLV